MISHLTLLEINLFYYFFGFIQIISENDAKLILYENHLSKIIDSLDPNLLLDTYEYLD
jgi:hypothetical protein